MFEKVLVFEIFLNYKLKNLLYIYIYAQLSVGGKFITFN